MEYLISKPEITRRKKAYISFCVSLLAGALLGSFFCNFPIPFPVYILISFPLVLLGLFSFRFFRTVSRVKIRLTPKMLERQIGESTEEYPLGEIERVRVKWTSKKTVREIYILLKKNKNIAITALDSFERFKDDLEKKLPGIRIQETHEPLDFDHVLFYPILGLLIGSLSVFGFTLLLNETEITMSRFFLSPYLVILGMYLMLTKHLAKRLGKKDQFSDYLLGGFMIFLGIVVLFFL